MHKVEQYQKNMAALPEMCVVRNPHGGEQVIVKRGEEGCYPITRSDLIPDQIDNFNQSVGVTRAQEMAMLHGSMFGFETPAAHPSYWEYEAFFEELRAEFAAQPKLGETLIDAFKHYKKAGLSLAEAKQRASKLMIAARGGEGVS